jgi:hypothetical protein
MANTNLIKKLTEKWSQPDSMPGKGYELVKALKQDYYVQPLSFCNLENSSSKEGSEWAISGGREEKFKPRFNAPKGFNS